MVVRRADMIARIKNALKRYWVEIRTPLTKEEDEDEDRRDLSM
jgi:hypothetical protein